MLLTSNFMLNHSDSPFAHSIFPYLHSYSNHKTVEHHLLKRVLIPDVLPSEVLDGKGGEFSLVAGDFEEIYGSDGPTSDGSNGQKGKWASVVTCFFIDCVGVFERGADKVRLRKLMVGTKHCPLLTNHIRLARGRRGVDQPWAVALAFREFAHYFCKR